MKQHSNCGKGEPFATTAALPKMKRRRREFGSRGSFNGDSRLPARAGPPPQSFGDGSRQQLAATGSNRSRRVPSTRSLANSTLSSSKACNFYRTDNYWADEIRVPFSDSKTLADD